MIHLTIYPSAIHMLILLLKIFPELKIYKAILLTESRIYRYHSLFETKHSLFEPEHEQEFLAKENRKVETHINILCPVLCIVLLTFSSNIVQ